ncbi:MAG: AAA family ATPase [Nitrososphaerales archaeon]
MVRISISGKGGSGKTTLTALLLKVLLQNNGRSILVIDADPATNLPDTLGLKVEKTVGTVTNELRKQMDKDALSLGVSKERLLETWVYNILVETPNFDFLAMGRSEGEGCYCYINSVLTRILDIIADNYDIVLMDMEAGLEHLSRRTAKDVDILIIVTDPSKMGFETAKRIRELVDEVHIKIKNAYLIGNQFTDSMEGLLMNKAKEINVEYGGFIPMDPNIHQYNLEGKSLLNLPLDSLAVKAAERIAKRIKLL